MSRIRAKDTTPEMTVRKFLHAQGFRYRLHVKHLPGKPDIVLAKYKVAIFVHGCFWHGHSNCKSYKVPATRTEWWLEKIGKNATNDQRKQAELITSGWRTIEVWQCELKKGKVEATLSNLVTSIKQ